MPSLQLTALFYGLMVMGCALHAVPAQAQYVQTNLISNSAAYNPQIIDPTFGDSWGVAIRPAGFGGHFWITNKNTGTSSEWVGDVNGVPLHQDSLDLVTIPAPTNSPAGTVAQPTGVVFNQSNDFVITQEHPNGPITNASKFLFATNDGTISAWTERKNADGGFDRSTASLNVIDNSAQGDNYFGLTVTNLADNNHLYAANFGANPGIKVWDAAFNDVSAAFGFTNPFAADDFVPFNIENSGAGLLVAFAKSSGAAGEEEHGQGLGRLARYDYDGNLLATASGNGLLNAPWGMTLAPENFGVYCGKLLVSNFGDIDAEVGSIVALDPVTLQAIDYLRSPSGEPIVIPGIWGLTFGNGASLGDADSLYFAAGPNDELDGVFGRLRVATAAPEPGVLSLLLTGIAFCLMGIRLSLTSLVRPLLRKNYVHR